MADLLEFHRRAEKPQWWEMFARTELPFDDLLDSVDAIAGLARVPGSTVDEYEYPEQEIKFDAGEYAVWLEHPDGREGEAARGGRGPAPRASLGGQQAAARCPSA